MITAVIKHAARLWLSRLARQPQGEWGRARPVARQVAPPAEDPIVWGVQDAPDDEGPQPPVAGASQFDEGTVRVGADGASRWRVELRKRLWGGTCTPAWLSLPLRVKSYAHMPRGERS